MAWARRKTGVELSVLRAEVGSGGVAGQSLTAVQHELGNGIWLFDQNQNIARRLTSGRHNSPIWSPSGSTIVFRSANQILGKTTDGALDELPMTRAQYPNIPDWSRDGRFILRTEITPETQTKRDIWVLPVGPDGLLETHFSPLTLDHSESIE